MHQYTSDCKLNAIPIQSRKVYDKFLQKSGWSFFLDYSRLPFKPGKYSQFPVS